MRRDTPGGDRPRDVYFFATCLVDLFCPEAGMDAIALLDREGITVHFPEDQTCCGQPAYTSGFADAARSVALAQMRLFPNDWPVVVPSGSCAGMMRHHYPRLFADEPQLKAQAEALGERVFELAEFLLEVLQVKWQDRGAPTTVALHTSCTARREMGTHEHGRALLAQLPGVTVISQANEAECCGFGGTFSLKLPAISGAIAGDKADALTDCGAQSFVSADCGCLLNIKHTLQKRGAALQGKHLASFLRERIAEPGEKA
jgi:L-lactate dehydrogenase complex protein LldE